MLGANNGSSVLLECLVDAFPPALTYWLVGENRIIEESNWKYRTLQQELSPSSIRVTLNITYVESADYSDYKCVAKNERGKTHAQLTVFGETIIRMHPHLLLLNFLSLFFLYIPFLCLRNRSHQTQTSPSSS
jgi:hypothetical protein